MKNLPIIFAATTLLLLGACSNENEKKSDIIQHQTVSKEPMDGPVKKIVLNIDALQNDVETPKLTLEKTPLPTRKRFVNKAPEKTLEELKMEVFLIEEQGCYADNAAQIYNQLGDAFLQINQYEDALAAFSRAEDKGYDDLKNLYFKMARTYALNGDYYGSMEDLLAKARTHGFRNYRALLYDTAFAEWREEYEFIYQYHELFGDNKKAMFKAFVTFAPNRSISKDWVVNPAALFENTHYEYREASNYYEKYPLISGYFDEFATGVMDGMFSREGGDNYRYEMLLDQNKHYTAVVYSKESEWSEYVLPKKYQLVTFDKEGNKISELEIAKRGTLSKCKGFVFHPDNTLEVTNYKVDWKPGTKEQANDNGLYLTHKELKSATAQDTKTYMIAASGRIVETEGFLIGMR